MEIVTASCIASTCDQFLEVLVPGERQNQDTRILLTR